MVEHDGIYDDAAAFPDAFHGSAVREDDRTLRRRMPDRATESAEPLATTARRHLRRFIDRLFDGTMPRTGAGEAARLRAPMPPLPTPARSWPAAPAQTGFVYPGSDYLATGRSGLLDWVDDQLGLRIGRLSTPLIIQRVFAAVLALTLLAVVTSLVTLSQVSGTLQTIRLQTLPAIDAAERLRISLGAMDVDAASDSLLSDSVSTGTSREFAGDIDGQIAALVQASAGLAFDEAETVARLKRVQYDLHLYYGILGEARDAGRTKPWIAAQRAKFASRLLRSHVMAEADALERGDLQHFAAISTQSQRQSLLFGLSYVGIGTLLAATLIGAQIILRRRTRRLINLPLAAATALLVIVILWVGVSIRAEQADLRAGETSALAQLVALRGAKAAASAINADQAMWLIDHEANRVDYEQDFDHQAARILGVDPTDEANLAALQAQYAASPAVSPPLLTGLLGSTFAAEAPADPARRPAAAAIAGFLDLLRVDRHLRGLEAQGDHRGALELRTGTGPGQSLFAFRHLNKAADEAIEAAETSLGGYLSSAVTIAAWLKAIALAALVFTAGLAVAGLWQRYQEYR